MAAKIKAIPEHEFASCDGCIFYAAGCIRDAAGRSALVKAGLPDCISNHKIYILKEKQA